MRVLLSCVLALLLCFKADTGLAAEPKDPVFNQEQLDQMLAPIALYPDPLLAQVLMAVTYPGEVAEAVAWSKANPKAKGDDAVKQVASQPWDPSVQSLVAFPQILATLGQDPVWVQRLGDAFLAQSDDVMNSVQRLRRQAKAAGNLQSNQYQNVTVQAPATTKTATTQPASSSSGDTTIIIQPADPQTVYVPTYNPTTTYGTWAYPASPPVYYPPPPMYYPGSALMAGLAFGTGVAIIASVWGDCDWGNNDIDIDVNRYNQINANNRIGDNQNRWQHNPAHRDGVPYRDNRSREQYGRQLDGASQRAAFRGDDGQRAQARQKALNSMDRAGIQRPATSNRQAQDRARAAQTRMDTPRSNPAANQRRQGEGQARQNVQQRPATGANRARNNAFEGVRSPARTTQQIDRGRSSQSFSQRPNPSRSIGQPVSRPSNAGMRQRGGRR